MVTKVDDPEFRDLAWEVCKECSRLSWEARRQSSFLDPFERSRLGWLLSQLQHDASMALWSMQLLTGLANPATPPVLMGELTQPLEVLMPQLVDPCADVTAYGSDDASAHLNTAFIRIGDVLEGLRAIGGIDGAPDLSPPTGYTVEERDAAVRYMRGLLGELSEADGTPLFDATGLEVSDTWEPRTGPGVDTTLLREPW
ncbi:MAG: hypothetical protein QM621_08120 [Aeromicrobium sp.]|uniref:hypothetical protein n=1 Tax=Aeromicrobium sp. TaxID=1871063 RepID=UPI0039E3701E